MIGVRVKGDQVSQRDRMQFNNDGPKRPARARAVLPPLRRARHAELPARPRQFSTAQGSGFFISADGYAVTNNHVVERGKTIEVQTDDNKTYTAKVIGTDPKTDLALLKVDGRTDFPFVKLGDKQPRIGDWVIAVGNPFGLGGTVTAGIVSARGRDIGAGPYDDFIQIDAPVNKGNSGGPTFDTDGNVIGVNTAIFSPNGGSIGIGFAIPAETVKAVVAQLKDHGSVTRGWIGVQIQPVTADVADSLGLKKAEGALVAEAQANSPAAKAGIASGDVITSVNGDAIKDARELAKKIGALAPGATAHLGVVSKGTEKTVAVTLSDYPKDQPAPRRQHRARAGQRRAAPRPHPRAGRQRRRCRRQGRRRHRGRPRRPRRRARLQDRRRHPRGRRQGGREPGRRAQGAGRSARRRQAHRPDAREVGRRHEVRRGAAAPRMR